MRLVQKYKYTNFAKDASSWKCSFFQQMLVLMNSGINIDIALKLLCDGEQKNSKHYGILNNLHKQVCSGDSMSHAMKKCYGLFSDVEINIMRAAEEVGKIYLAFEQLSEFSLKFQKLKKKIVSASIYPSIVLFISFIVLILLSVFVIPRFEDLFNKSVVNVQMPMMTIFVISLCKMFTQHFLLIFCCLSIFCGSLFLFRKSQKYRLSIDYIWLHVPVLKTIVINYNLSLFFKTAGILLSFGVSIQKSLMFAKNVLSNSIIRNQFSKKLTRIYSGDGISQIFKLNKYLHPCDVGLILAGEKSGKLDVVFQQIAEFAEDKIDNTINKITTLIEPFLIIFLAVVVGTIVAALFLPMINIMSSFD